MNKLPPITVAMPVYNGARTIQRAIDSLLSQSFTEFTLLISDNCSTDGTHLICERYAQRDSRVVFHRQISNLGAVGNFDFLLKNANSPFFMFAAADDYWGPQFLEITIKHLNLHSGMVSASVAPFGRPCKASEKLGFTNIEQSNANARLSTFLRHLPDQNSRFYGVHKLEALRGISFASLGFVGGDWFFMAVLVMRGTIGVVYDPESGFQKSPGGTSEHPFYLVRANKSLLDRFFPLRRFVTKIRQFPDVRLDVSALLSLASTGFLYSVLSLKQHVYFYGQRLLSAIRSELHRQ